jgi:ATP-binding cassette, subfamily B, bacterial
MNAGLAEAIAGIEVVKGSAQEAAGDWKNSAPDAGLYRDHFIKQGEIQARYLPMLVFSIAWGGLFARHVALASGVITLGEVVAFIGLVGIFALPHLYFHLLL